MRKYIVVQSLVGSILLFFILMFFGAIILDHHERSRAEQLAAQVKLLSVGATSADATRLIDHFAGRKVEFPSPNNGSGNLVLGISPCSDADAVYGIVVGPTYKVNRILSYFPRVDHIGLHPWDVGASLFFKDQKLICLSETARTWRTNGDALFAQAYIIFLPLPGLDNVKTYSVSSARLRGNIYRLEVRVSARATTQEREKAFTLDLHCVTSWAGCSSPGEIMPLSWQRYLQTSAEPNE